MNPIRSCLLCFTILVALAVPAQAAALDQASADKLKAVVESFLTEQKKLAEIDGKTKIDLQGETTVEEAGEFYAVTLPYIKVIQSGGDQVDVGMISINALPGDSAGQWKLRLAMPTPIVISDKAGKEITRMTIGGQRAAGIWDESLRSFIKLDALYKDILFSGTDGSSVKIPETRIVYDFTKDAANKWSGPGSVTFKNIEATPKTGGSMKAAEVKADFSIDQYDSNAIRAYREKLAALSESMAKDVTSGQGKISPAHTGAIASMMADFLSSAGNGMKVRYSLSGINITKPANAAGPAQDISIPSGFFGMDLTGFSTGKVKMVTQLGYNGLRLTPTTEEGLTPTEANIDLTIENIPVRDVLNLGKNTIDATVQNPELSKVTGGLFLPKLYSLLSQSGALVTVNNTHIGNADIDVRMEGTARADISAALSGTANTKVSIRGLDTLIERIKAQEGKPGKNIAMVRQSVQQLQMFKNIARVETRPGSPTLHVVEFELTPQGKMTINGQDLAAALAKAQAPAQTPKPQ
jgi:hypothetical protein